MAYVPQFVPTDTRVLQGTMDEYQKAYDTETARFNQAEDLYSAIPTTRAYDTTKKNEEMSKFSTVIDKLDKKYNYDRANTQYAKDLAREISGLRSNPLWAHIQQKDEIDKIRTQLKAQRGVDYHENFNPNDITLENANKLQGWMPQDLKDLDRGMMEAAIAKTQTMQPSRSWKDTGKGYWDVKETQGFESRNQAIDYLTNDEEGKALVKDTATALGFDPNDPKIYARALTAAMDKLIGQTKYTTEINRDYIENLRNKGNDNLGPANARISTVKGPPVPYAGTLEKVHDLKGKNNELTTKVTTATTQEDKDMLLDQINANTREIDRIEYLQKRLESDPIAQPVIKTGEKPIKNNLPNISQEKASRLNDKMRSYYTDTNWWERNASEELATVSATQPLLAGFINNLKKSVDITAAIGSFASESSKVFLPWSTYNVYNKGTKKQAANILVDAGTKILEKINKPVDLFNQDSEKSKIAFSTNEAMDMIKENVGNGKYGDVKSMKEGSPEMKKATTAIQRDLVNLSSSTYKALDEYGDYFNSKRGYINSGYRDLHESINKQLKEGEIHQMDESAPILYMKPATYTNFVDQVTSVMDRFDIVSSGNEKLTQGESKQWNPQKLEEVKADIQKNGGADVRIFTNGDDPMLLHVISKDGKHKFALEVDERKSTFDPISWMFNITGGDQNILNQYYRNIDLVPGKRYDIEDVLPMIPQFVGIQDNKGLEDTSIELVNEDNALKYKLYLSKDDDKPLEYPNKKSLINKLKILQKASNN